MKARLIACVVVLLAAKSAWASGYTNLNVGIAARNEGRIDDAIRYLGLAIAAPDLSPSLLPVAYYDRATMYLASGKFAEAAADCDALLRLKTDWFEAYEACGMAHGLGNDHAGAMADFNAAIKLEPDMPTGYLIRAVSYARAGDLDAAIADDGNAIERDPQSPTGYAERAAHYELQNHFDLALADLKAADALKDDYQLARAIGIDQWALGQFEDAISSLERARRLDTTSLYSLIWLAIAQAGKNPDQKPDIPAAPDNAASAWPAPVLNYYRGAATTKDVMAAAASGGGATALSQTCEADFYIGEWQKLHGSADGAKPLFEDAVRTCPHEFVEYMTATTELRRMKQGP